MYFNKEQWKINSWEVVELVDLQKKESWTGRINYFQEKYKKNITHPLELDFEHPFLGELKTSFENHVVWQQQAKNYLSQAILKSVLKIWEHKWPLWVFFFYWPTWVWKTEIVKALASTMFWDEWWFIKINCENLQQPHTSSTLFWAPPWYLWFDKQPRLTNKSVMNAFDVAKQMKKLNKIISWLPWFNIILFDEIEKAHPDVIQQLLWLIDEWKVITANWEVVNFQNSIIIFTSNVWQKEINWLKWKTWIWFSQSKVDKKEIKKQFEKSLKEKFSLEFIWRIHNFVEFHELEEEDCKKIIYIQVKKFNEYLLKYFAESHIQIELSPWVYDYIIKKWYSQEKWARELVIYYNSFVKTYIDMLFHSDQFAKYYDYSWKVLIWVDINNNEKLEFLIILDWDKKTKKEVKVSEVKNNKNNLDLDKLNQIFTTISVYVELTYINLDWDVDIKDELKIYANKLKEFWLSQTDISWLKNRAYLEWLRDLVFIQDFEALWNWDDIKDLFYPYETRTLMKIIERKLENIYWEKWSISKKKFVKEWVKSIVEFMIKLLRVEELSWSQTNQLLFYIRKVLVEKYWIKFDY